MKREPAEKGNFKLTEEERKGYSLERALHYLFDPAGLGRASEVEMAVAQRALKEGATSHEGGVYIPFEAFSRDLVVGTHTSGGALVGTQAVGFEPLLLESSTIAAVGATFLENLTGNVQIPRQTSTATPYWVTENVAPSESQQAFDSILMSPKTVGTYTDVSRRLITMSSVGIVDMIRRDLLDAVGSALDEAAFRGSGIGALPRGVLNTSGVSSLSAGPNGGAPTYDHVVELERLTTIGTRKLRNLAYVTTPKVRSKLLRTQKFPGTNGESVWARSGSKETLNGLPATASPWVPSDLIKGTSGAVCSALLFGPWADLLIGIWGSGMTVMIDPYTQSTSGGVRIVVLFDVDVAVRYPSSFSIMSDLLTT